MMGVLQGASAEMQMAAQKIAGAQHVKVQQKRQLLQGFCACIEQQNKYVIYDGPDVNSNPIYYVQETSTCFERIILGQCQDCKPWRMDYHNIPPTGMTETPTDFPVFMHIERPCSLTCCCFNRPEAIITEQPSGRVLGKLRDPWHCYNLTFQVQDAGGVTRLSTNTCCIQKGLCCPWPCCGCQVHYPIDDAGDGHQVAQITKTWMMGDLCPLCFKDWDNNVIHFGEAANPDYKMLLITLATFIQMRYFDSRNQGN